MHMRWQLEFVFALRDFRKKLIESLHIGQWAMGNGRQKSLPIAHCLLPRSTKLAFFGQWAMGCGWLHAHKFASYRILPCATWAMGNEHFFPAHCNCPLLSVAQWLHSWAMGIGRYATCIAHLRCLGDDLGDFRRPNGQWATRAPQNVCWNHSLCSLIFSPVQSSKNL